MKSKLKKIILIIPVRMGSKRLKNKNILPIKKVPMFVYVARKILKSKFSSKTIPMNRYVNTKNVISDLFHLDDSIFFLMIKYCFIDNNIVLCLVILLLHSNNGIVGLAVLVCNNLILFCNIIMFLFTKYHTVLFLLLYYIVVLSIIIMFYCFVMLVCTVILLCCVL